MARSSDDDGDGRGRDDAGDGRDGQDDDGRDGRGGGGGNRATELLRAIPRRRTQFLPPLPLRGSGVGGRERRRGGPGYDFSASFSASNVRTRTISIHFT